MEINMSQTSLPSRLSNNKIEINNKTKDINNNNDNSLKPNGTVTNNSQFTIEAEVYNYDHKIKDEEDKISIISDQFKLVQLSPLDSNQIRPFYSMDEPLKFVNFSNYENHNQPTSRQHSYAASLDYTLDTTSTDDTISSQSMSSNDNIGMAFSELSKTDETSSFEMISEALGTLDNVLINAENGRLNGSQSLRNKSSLMSASALSLHSIDSIGSLVPNKFDDCHVNNNIVSQPKALTMDGSDEHRGQSTWETVNLLADCILKIWSDKPNSTTTKIFGNQLQNSVLSNPIKYLCLRPELSDRFLLYPDARLPFRKSYSEINLSQLGIDSSTSQSDKELTLTRTKTKKYDFMKNSISSSRHIANSHLQEENSESIARNRSRTSLTMFQAKQLSSDKATEQRKDRFNLNLTLNMKTKAKLLASKNELDDSSKFARRLSKLEKKYYLDISERELMSLVFKKEFIDCVNLKEIIKFGQEISQLIANLICAEFTVEDQGQLIANIIEALFILYHSQNFQSFESVIRGLSLPEVYRLTNAWKVVQQKYPLHLSVYHYMASVLTNKMHNSVMYPSTPSLPTLGSFIKTLEIRCISIWDQLEGKRHWRHAPNLVDWLNQYEFDESAIEKKVKLKLITEIDSKLNRWRKRARQKLTLRNYMRMRRKNTLAKKLTKREKPNQINYETLAKLKSLYPFACIENSQLPNTWTLRSTRHLPNEFQMMVMREFKTVYDHMMNKISVYKF